jgi:diguanylate cyclase (GGDEF)-like protein
MEETTSQQGNIMQGIQDMIGNLLVNTIEKMQANEMNKQADGSKSSVDMDIGMQDIKNFVAVMQKFIDNVNITIRRLEGVDENEATDDEFLENYMATADNVLEIAAFTMKDKLTGLSNRYGFDQRLTLEWNRAARDKSALALIIFGVRDVKEYVGAEHEDLMKLITRALQNTIKRSTDFFARWGDDEFAILLPTTDDAGAMIVATRVFTEIGSAIQPHLKTKSNIAVGLNVHIPAPKEVPADFIANAHKVFLAAKENESGGVVSYE